MTVYLKKDPAAGESISNPWADLYYRDYVEIKTDFKQAFCCFS